ncbi:MAG TPA: DEAD/DEAH box helicase, partial [Candidatus Limnocylindrales bacterium]|nr:DEAD/DEAH box helicase [Candidatus Limnocylindrales bacterium]
MSFSALGLDPKVLQAVREAGYTEPTPIQAQAIPQILSGHDLIGIAQTGTGKTAAFTLPMLTKLAAVIGDGRQRGTRALILAPTRELALQIQDNIRAYAQHLPLRVATVFGGVGEHPQIDALRAGTHLIIACPGRLMDLMQRRYADFSQLQYLVLDEADRMLDMGFLPSIRQIVRSLPQKRQTLMFSASLSKEIESLTHEFQRSPKIVQIGRRANPAETVTQLIYEVPKHLKPALLLHLLRDPAMNMVLVFSRMKHAADRVARNLEQSGIKTATLHSNRSQNQRLKALKDFKSGAVRVLVATDIAARGIDVDGISHVVNYDFPMQSEDYVHRIGRTGRAHAVGDAISFVTHEDQGELRALERFIGRGIVRKKAEGFNYSAAAPAFNPADERRHPQHQSRGQRPPRNQPRSHGSSSQSRSPQSGRPQQRSSGGQLPVSGNREGA